MSPEFRAGERVVSISHLYPCCECGGASHAYASFEGRDGIEWICERCVEAEDAELYEDDGQPTEYEEWQDYMGGDDWDHGQFDDVAFYDELF